MMERSAAIATIVQESPGEFYLVLGEGKHDFDRWKLSESLVRKLVIEGFAVAMKSNGKQ